MKKQELIEYLNELTPDFVRDDEITASEYAEANKIHIVTARRLLDDLVSKGILTKRPARSEETGQKLYAYKKTDA